MIKKVSRMNHPVALTTFAFALMLAASCTSTKAAEALERNRIYVLGSLHSKMLKHPHYSLSVFVQAIEQFHPDLILAEVRADHPGPIEGCIDGGIEQGIVYAYGSVRKVPVVAVDWFDDDYEKRMDSFEPKFKPDIEKKLQQLGHTYMKLFGNATFLRIQDKGTESIVEQMYTIHEQNGDVLSRERNEHICKRIDEALAGKHGLRVLIVFGLDHKYYFDRYLSSDKNNKILTIHDWYEPRKPTKVPAEIRELSIQNIRASQKLLNERLKNDYYQGEDKKKLSDKAAIFDSWVAKLESL